MTLRELGKWLTDESVNPTDIQFATMSARHRAHLIGIFIQYYDDIKFHPSDFKNKDGEGASPEAAAQIANNILKSIKSDNYEV